MSADRPRRIISQLDVLGRGERRRVYCQNAEVASLLKQQDSSYDALPLPTQFPKENADASVVIGHNPAVFSSELREAIEKDLVRLIYVLADGLTLPPEASGIPIFSFLVPPLQPTALSHLLDRAFQSLRLANQQATIAQELQRVRGEIDQLNQIGIALSTERDMKSLLDLILRKGREITNSDAGSLYLIEADDQGEKCLRFKITQNDSLEVPFEEFTLPIDATSIAGYVAFTAEEGTWKMFTTRRRRHCSLLAPNLTRKAAIAPSRCSRCR